MTGETGHGKSPVVARALVGELCVAEVEPVVSDVPPDCGRVPAVAPCEAPPEHAASTPTRSVATSEDRELVVKARTRYRSAR
jgi:hypothetical protein